LNVTDAAEANVLTTADRRGFDKIAVFIDLIAVCITVGASGGLIHPLHSAPPEIGPKTFRRTS
jgi:hypothetical protein